MKFVAKCSVFINLSYQVHVNDCNPIPLSHLFTFILGRTADRERHTIINNAFNNLYSTYNFKILTKKSTNRLYTLFFSKAISILRHAASMKNNPLWYAFLRIYQFQKHYLFCDIQPR